MEVVFAVHHQMVPSSPVKAKSSYADIFDIWKGFNLINEGFQPNPVIEVLKMLGVQFQ